LSISRFANGAVLRLALAALAGAAMVLTFAPFGAWWLQPLLLAALFLLWDGAAPRRAAAIGFGFGMGWFCTGVSWVYISMHDIGGMPVVVAALATLLFAMILASYTALAGFVQARLAPSSWTRTLVVVPAALTLSEWLRGWVFTGFPWIAPGYAHTDGPLAGFAPLLGVHGLTYLAVLVASLLTHALSAVTAGKPLVEAALRPMIGFILVVGAGLGLNLIEWTHATGKPVTVSLIQGNIPQELKFVEGRFESTIDTYVRLAERHPAELIVFPETALPRMLHTIPRTTLERLDMLASSRGATLVTGVPRATSATRYFNSTISLGRDAGQHYDKDHLVPFGEFIPFGFRWFVDLMRMPLGDFTSGGTRQAPMRIGAQRVALNICYEDLFGEEIIRQLPEAGLLLNVSNIGWFGDSLAPHQHLQASRMRAIESGRTMLRATNTGATAVIDAHGTVTQALPFFSEGALVATVQARGGATPYVLTGNWCVITLCAAALAWAWRGARRRSLPPARVPA
jgi:apolipoprotein N-acyltransferase